jgi:hypothetical protein
MSYSTAPTLVLPDPFQSATVLEGEVATRRYIELIAGDRDAELCFRLLRDHGKSGAVSLNGRYAELESQFSEAQDQGFGLFAVVNRGGHIDLEIDEVRAAFIDADGVSLSSVVWHKQPSFIVFRTPDHWHAYWLVENVPLDTFKPLQKRLAAHYGTDSKVSNLSRVMRLPGSLHLKVPSMPMQLRLLDLTDGLDMSTCRALSTLDLPGITDGLVEDHGETASSPGAPRNSQSISAPILSEMLSFIDPTFADDHDTWVGIAKSVRHNEIGVLDVEEADLVAIVTSWCSGDLWRERTGDSRFIVSTFHGEDELLHRLEIKPRARGAKIGIGTIHRLAVAGGYRGSRPDEMALYDKLSGNQEATNDNDANDRPLSAAEIASGNFPPPEHLIDGLVLKHHVNLLYGDGGSGKTQLALQMAVAVATGTPFFDRATEGATVFLLLAEDGPGEVKRRLQAICADSGSVLGTLPLQVWSRTGMDSVLADVSDEGDVTEKPFIERLRKALPSGQHTFLVLDTISDVATLDENLRLPVNALCKRVLGGMCHSHDVTLLVLAHPSKASMEDGNFYSGSTAWNNAVRSRLTLAAAPGDSNPERTLKVAKSNYGKQGKLDLVFVNGLLKSRHSSEYRDEAKHRRGSVKQVVLEMVDQGIRVVRGNGTGQKPEDVATAVNERYGLRMEKREVREHLGALERGGILKYESANKNDRGSRAGFVRGPNADLID